MHKLSVPRGTQDVLPAAWRARHRVLDVARRTFEHAGFGRIATPTFEETALFVRGIGEGTDIVGKEMYTFHDRSDRSLTLRPEGTAPVVRAYISEGLQRAPQPVRLWYFAPMFRYEAPQKGRYREHYQIGAEIFGSTHPSADAEAIGLLDGIYRELGIAGVTLRLNSIGDSECRPAYRERLVGFLTERSEELCEDCRKRIHLNPLRTFDCKQERCRAVMAEAPRTVDSLCDACADHFAAVRATLDAMGVDYTLDASLVRGLDYYTRTTFEFSCRSLGAQDAIGGGGRYDSLVESLGGPATPAVGFGCGIERVLLALKATGHEFPQPAPDVYLCAAGDEQRPALAALARQLRPRWQVDLDLMGRGLGGQLKQASRLGARLALIAEGDGWRIHEMRGRTDHPTTAQTAGSDIERMLEET